MMADAYDSSRADHIYRIGPETLTAQAFAVATGPVARYSKQTTEMSQPGPDGFALRWVVSGRFEHPEVIKGRLPSGDVVPFERFEQSGMLPAPQPVAAWERDLGDLDSGDEALLFLLGDPVKPTFRVLPSREPATGLAATVRRAAAIQALDEPSERRTAWLDYLQSAATDEGRQAALRSLIATGGPDWSRLQPVLSAVLLRPGLSPQMRGYVAGIVAWSVMQDRWAEQQLEAAEFVCRQFDEVREPWLALQLALTLKQLMAFGAVEPADAVRRQIRQRVAQSVRRAAAGPGVSPDVEQQLQQLREAHPGEF